MPHLRNGKNNTYENFGRKSSTIRKVKYLRHYDLGEIITEGGGEILDGRVFTKLRREMKVNVVLDELGYGDARIRLGDDHEGDDANVFVQGFVSNL